MAVLNVWDRSLVVVQGHYQLDIPFKKEKPDLPDNREMAVKRLQHLRKRMKIDAGFGERYAAGIQDYITQGYAEKVDPDTGAPGMIWYIPHHAVVTPKKPDKLRIVFDCSAKYNDA